MNEWIDVNYRLPDKFGDYLCCCSSAGLGSGIGPSIRVLGFTKEAQMFPDLYYLGLSGPMFYDYDSEVGYYRYSGVTHWMPLPELPK